jgi:uncharacterized phage infection (PIP) family protein YhgE
MQPTGGNTFERIKDQLDNLVRGSSEANKTGSNIISKSFQDSIGRINQTLRGEGYNLQNSKAFLRELDDYLSSVDIPLKQKAQIKQNITDGIRQNSQPGKIVPRRTISGQ